MSTYSDPSVVSVGKPNRVHMGPVIALVAGILALGQAGFLFFQNIQTQNKYQELQQEVTTKQTRLDQLKPVVTRLNNLSNQTQGLHVLFDNQVRWEKVLAKIEERLYKNMVITSLQMDDTGAITFSGETPDYANYAKLYRSLTDESARKVFSNVKPLAVTKGTGEVSTVIFSFSLNIQSDVLYSRTVEGQ